jgi:hypothetical protein
MTLQAGSMPDQEVLFDASPHAPAPDGIKGLTEPRLYTPELRPLTSATTAGPEIIRFAKHTLGIELYPWQKWWLMHAFEYADPGAGVVDRTRVYRFRTVLTLVGRQSGKTTLLKVVALWLMTKRPGAMVLGAAQSMDIAREAWSGAVDIAETNYKIAKQVAAVKRGNTETSLKLVNGSRYRLTATRQGAGRGLSVNLLILDEIREQKDWQAWSALSKTTIAQANGLIVAISNAGDATSVVLNQLRESALAGLDPSIGLMEWSGYDGCELDDWGQIAQACPGLGYGVSAEAIRTSMGTDPPSVFRTEILCQSVESLDSPISAQAWNACGDPAGSRVMEADRKFFCLDVAPEGEHATLAAASVTDSGRVRVGVVGAWSDLSRMVADLPGLIAQYQPKTLGWFPGGPAAAVMADLHQMRAPGQWTAKSVGKAAKVELKSAEIPAVCQGLAEQVRSRMIIHGNDPLLNAHVLGSHRLPMGDGWRFSRKFGNADAAYAAAGAVHLARVARPTQRLKLVVSRGA